MYLLFDSHLDLAWNAVTWRRDLLQSVEALNAAEAEAEDAKFRGRATTTLPEMRAAKLAVFLGTMMGRVPYGESQLHGSTLDFPTHSQVFAFAQGQLGYYEALEWAGEIRILKTAEDLAESWAAWQQPAAAPLGMILAMEGADAIMNAAQVPLWFAKGLRCASLVHYGTSKYAVGTGQEGPLSSDGRELLEAFDACGIVLDVTHLSDTSFYEAIDSFSGPVCASHQACRSLVPGQRQFTDEQLRIVVERGGVVGVPCDAWMLSPGWVRGETDRSVVSISAMADHMDHICQLTGNAHHAAIGSDLDGGYGTEQTPTGLDTIADLQQLAEILAARGYSDPDIRRILGENWLRFFERHLPRRSA